MKHQISILALLSSLLLGAPMALAADATIQWQNPTQQTDGRPIPATGPEALARTRIEYGTCNGTAFGTAIGQQEFPQPATTGVITNLVAGSTYCFRGYAINNAGDTSGPSNVVTRAVPTTPPRPPVLSSTVNIAFYLSPSRQMKVAGTIPFGVPCNDASVMVEGVRYHTIDEPWVAKFSNRPVDRYFTICEVTG